MYVHCRLHLHRAFGQRAGFIGTEDVHATEIFDSGEALNDDFFFGHAFCAVCEIHTDDCRKKLGRYSNREGEGKKQSLHRGYRRILDRRGSFGLTAEGHSNK